MRTQHNPFVRGVRYLCYLLAVVGLIALMIVSALTVIDAVLRRYFAGSIDGLSDVLEWCIVVAVSACFPAMLWRKNAITVRVLGTILPWRVREALDLLGDLLLLAVIATVAWQLTLYTRDVWRYGDVTMLMAEMADVGNGISHLELRRPRTNRDDRAPDGPPPRPP